MSFRRLAAVPLLVAAAAVLVPATACAPWSFSTNSCHDDGSASRSCGAGESRQCVTCTDDTGDEHRSSCSCVTSETTPSSAPSSPPTASLPPSSPTTPPPPAPLPMCDGFEMRCGDVCTDLHTDPANCGLCGIRCLSGESCELGFCS